jgi:hypothetical protein
MINFIKDVRNELEVTDLPFIIDTTGMITESPSGFGYHWNNSGKSHFLDGDTTNKAMVKSLKNK